MEGCEAQACNHDSIRWHRLAHLWRGVREAYYINRLCDMRLSDDYMKLLNDYFIDEVIDKATFWTEYKRLAEDQLRFNFKEGINNAVNREGK